jgi:two-component system, cell cycle sensor histidine kinase and response regulator CckA
MPVMPTYEELERRLQELEETIRILQMPGDNQDRCREQEDPQFPIEYIGEIFFRNLPDGTIIFVSPYCKHLLGYSPSELLGRRSTELVHPDDMSELLAIVADTVERQGNRYRAQYRLRHRDGSYIWVETCGSIVYGPEGSPYEMFCVVRDIADIKRSEFGLLQRAEELTVLKELGRKVNMTLSLEKAVEAGLQGILKAVNADQAFLFLRQGERLILQNIQPSHARQLFEGIPEHRVGECICGLSITEGRPLYSLDISADRRCTWDECKKAGIRSFAALPLYGPDGVIGVVGLTSRVLRDFAKQSEFLETLAGQVSGALVNARLFEAVRQELTERVKVEVALRDSERQFRLLAENSADMISRHDPEGMYMYASPACSVILGYAQDEMIGRSAFEFIHPDDIDTVEQSRMLVIADPAVNIITYRLRCKDGSYKWCESTSHSVRHHETGRVVEIQVTTRDITERRGAEQALREEENRTRSIVDSLPIGMHIYRLESDERLIFIGANPAADAILGVDNNEFIGKTIEEAFPGLSETEVPLRYKEAAAQGPSWQTEQIVYHKGQIQGAFEVHAFRIAPRMMAAVFGDITERKKAEIALQAMSQRQKAMLAAIPDIIMEINADKVYTWANQAGLSFFGEDVIGKEASAFFVEEQDTYEKVQPLFDGNEEVMYLRSWQRRVDGQKRLLAWWCRALEDEHKNVTGAISSARDITDQKHLEEKLIQAQKMESIGRLAGGVAHDFNNMLQTIMGHSDLAIGKVGKESSVRDNLLEIQKAARRSADLTRQLLTFARKQTVSPMVLDLNDTVIDILKILRRLIGEDIELIWKPGPNLWPLLIDPTQVDQILANLGVNARDAISGVGTLSIATENVVIDVTHRESQADYLPGDYVMLSVSDNGCGMEKEVLHNIFDPFFTTKEVGKGTGLGLATVYGIVKQNNGWINVYSEPGMGTAFKIYLPRAEREVEVHPVVEERRPSRGSETVLLVEDDASILTVGVDILRSFGYTVLPAKDPGQALELIRQQKGPIHLLLTDVVMPGMNGKDLRDKVVVLRPEIRVIFMSGYTDDVIAHHGILDPDIHFLQKPFSVSTLTDKVRGVLDGL